MLGETAFKEGYVARDRHHHGKRMGWAGFILAAYALYLKTYPTLANKFEVSALLDLTKKYGIDDLCHHF